LTAQHASRRQFRREMQSAGMRERYEPVMEYNPTVEELEAVSTVEQFYDPQKTAKAHLEKQWAFNQAFLQGNQWLDWDRELWKLVPLPRKGRKRVRDVRNFIRARAEMRLSYLTGFTPDFKGRPETNDYMARQRAKVGQNVAMHYWVHQRMPQLLQDWVYWAITCGTGFAKVYWDKQAGESFVGPDVEKDEFGQPFLVPDRERLYFEGDVVTEILPPFGACVDPMATTWRDVTRFCEISVRPFEWVDRVNPERGRHARGGPEESDAYHTAALNMYGASAINQVENTGETSEEWATVKEYYETPRQEYPYGRRIVMAGNVVLEMTDNPAPRGQIPYVPFKDLLVPGQFWGQSNIDNELPLQLNYNRATSQKLEHVTKLVYAKLLWPRAAGQLPESSFVSKVGEVLNYGGVTEPKYVQPPNLPNDINDLLVQCKADLDDVTMTYGVERGMYQGRISGTATNFLQEAGQRSKRPTVQRLAYALEDWARLVVETAHKNVSTERVIKMHGKDGQFDVSSFQGQDLEGATDIVLDVQSVMPKSKELAMTWVERLTQIGLLQPDNGPKERAAWKLLDQESEEPIVDDKAVHREKAKEEFENAMRGFPLQPHEWYQDLDGHIDQHRRDLNSDEYAAAPPQFKVAYLAHVQDTLMKAMPTPGVTLPPDQQGQIMQPESKDAGRTNRSAEGSA
jgi:hypothetical protein